MKDKFIDRLNISTFFKARIHQRFLPNEQHIIDVDLSKKISTKTNVSSKVSTAPPIASSCPSSSSSPFILYLPTVNLRTDQNPAFAFACHIANEHQLPLLVLAVLLDDHSMPLSSPFCSINHPSNSNRDGSFQQVTMTSRRLAFLTEALNQCTTEWFNHGAGVAIRVHKPNGGRTADHLTLSSRARAVVTDEPFVHPFVSFVHKVEKVCNTHSVPCYRVDGSTTVPPCSILKRRHINNNCISSGNNNGTGNNSIDDMVYYDGVPAKAWMWQKQTEHLRQNHIQAAMNGDFDAPELECKIDKDHFFISKSTEALDEKNLGYKDTIMNSINPNTFPLHWRNIENEAPSVRPWMVSELNDISNIKQWATQWAGADSSVPPCNQTVGTTKAGMQRWNNWVGERKGLIYYAKKRYVNMPIGRTKEIFLLSN